MVAIAETQEVQIEVLEQGQTANTHVEHLDQSPFRLYTGPTDRFGLYEQISNIEVLGDPLQTRTFIMKGLDDNFLPTSLNLPNHIVVETIPEDPDDTVPVPWSFGEPVSTDSYGFSTSDGSHDSLINPLDRYVRAIQNLHYEKGPDGLPVDGEAYQRRASEIADRLGFPEAHERSTQQPTGEAGSLAAAALPFLDQLSDHLPRRLQKVLAPLLLSSMLLNACGPKSQQPPEIRPTATRPAIVDIATPPPPTEISFEASTLSTSDELITQIPGLPPELFDAPVKEEHRLTDGIQQKLNEQGYAPVYSEVNGIRVYSIDYISGGSTVSALPVFESLFDPSENVVDPATGNVITEGSDQKLSQTNSVASYGDPGPNLNSTADDIVDTQVLTAVSVSGELPKGYSMIEAVVTDPKNPAKPGAIRSLLIDEQGTIKGEMQTAFSGDKVVDVKWSASDNTVAVTVDGTPLSFTLVPGFQFATETPTPEFTLTPEITATQVIQPTVETTQRIFNTELPDPKSIVLLEWRQFPNFGLPEGVSMNDLMSEQAFFDAIYEKLDLRLSSSYAGESSGQASGSVFAVIPIGIQKFEPMPGYERIRMRLLGFGPSGPVIFDKNLKAFGDSEHSIPCSIWSGELVQAVRGEHTCEQERIFTHFEELIKGKPMLISILTKQPSDVQGYDGLHYLLGLLGYESMYSAPNEAFSSFNSWGIALSLSETEMQKLTK